MIGLQNSLERKKIILVSYAGLEREVLYIILTTTCSSGTAIMIRIEMVVKENGIHFIFGGFGMFHEESSKL